MDSPPPNAHRLELTVEAADIDAQGHASNVAILGYLSRAAADHSASLGWESSSYRKLGGMFVVRRHEIDYHAQATEGQALACLTWPSGLAKATAERRYRLIRCGDGKTVAEGRTVWAYVDQQTGRPMRIPPPLREAFDPSRFA